MDAIMGKSDGIINAAMLTSMLPLGQTQQDELDKVNDNITKSQARQAKAQDNISNDPDASASWGTNYSNASADLRNIDQEANKLESNYQHDIQEAYNKDMASPRHNQFLVTGTDLVNLLGNVFSGSPNYIQNKYEQWADQNQAKVNNSYKDQISNIQSKRQAVLDKVASSHTLNYDNFVKGNNNEKK